MNEQFKLFFASIAIGIAGGFIYGLISIFRRYISHNIAGIYIEDFLYWSIFAIATFLIMLCLNYGDIRPYIIAGIISGLIIYGYFLHKYIIILLSPAIKLIRLIIEIILTPFNLVLLPIKKFINFFKKLLKNNIKYAKIKKMTVHKLNSILKKRNKYEFSKQRKKNS